MKSFSIAIMIYGDIYSGRDALTEEKYKELGNAFLSAGFNVRSVLYNEASNDVLYNQLQECDAILVWVNPIEQGKDRKKLDRLLLELSGQGCFVSTHPDVILKIGTKDVLYKTREMGWGSEANMYVDFESFVQQFPSSLHKQGKKVLKQYRGNGGNGVFQISALPSKDEVRVAHAKESGEPKTLSWGDFFEIFQPFFLNGGSLIEQEWNDNLVNGMVRCYLCGSKVAGFGYQEINALYEDNNGVMVPPSKRYYFTENCGLFRDLKDVMENSWVPQLQQLQAITDDMMPIIWDADFFINKVNSVSAGEKYSLCEINVSCVSPFPPSAIKFIVRETERRIQHNKS